MVSSSFFWLSSAACLPSPCAGLGCGTLRPTEVGDCVVLFCEVCVSLTVRTERSTRELRVEGGLRGFLLVGVEPRRDADLEIAQAEVRRERAANIVLDIVGDAFFERQHLVRPGIAAIRAGSEQLPVDIEHGDLIHRHRGQRRRDQMAHRLRDQGIVSPLGAQHHRGGRRLLGAAKRAFVRHHQMDARRLHAAHGLDGARQLALQRAHAGDFLHEGGEAERAELVEQFVAGAAGTRQALFGQQHARMGGVAVSDIDRRAVGGNVEGQPRVLQRRADARDILLVEAGIEQLIGGAAQVIARRADQRRTRRGRSRPARPAGAARARADLKTGVRCVRGRSFSIRR